MYFIRLLMSQHKIVSELRSNTAQSMFRAISNVCVGAFPWMFDRAPNTPLQ